MNDRFSSLLAVVLTLGSGIAGAADTVLQTVWSGQLERWHTPSSTMIESQAPAAVWPRGTRLTLHGDQLDGPPLLSCGRARPHLRKVAPEGLFQGALGAAAAAQAQRLGLPQGRVTTLRIDCDNASLDLHRDRAGRWLLMLDGRIAQWRDTGPGQAPAAAVLALLARHQSAQFPSLPAQVQALRPWLHPTLRTAFADYLRQPWPKDEVPPLDGDPFTDSQEPPDRLELGPAVVDGNAAQVPLRVVFETGGGREAARSLRYELQRHQGNWRLVDVRDEQRATLRDVLAQRPPAMPPKPR